MDTGTAIVTAAMIYVGWDILRTIIQFTWQMTVGKRRHEDEVEAARMPTSLQQRIKLDRN